MIYYKTREITLAADEVATIKERTDNYLSLIISNKTEQLVEVFFDDDYAAATNGIEIGNKTLSFESNDSPKNKVRVKNNGTEEVKLTILWSE